MAAHQASLSITKSRSLPKLMSIESVMASNHLILCVPFSSCLQSFPTSGSFQMSQLFALCGQNIGVSALLSGPSNKYSGLISFRSDWLDLLAVQGTLKSLLQHHSSKVSVLPMNIQVWFPLGWTGWISLQSKGLSRVFSNTTVQKHQFFGVSFLYSPTLISIPDYWKNHSFD